MRTSGQFLAVLLLAFAAVFCLGQAAPSKNSPAGSSPAKTPVAGRPVPSGTPDVVNEGMEDDDDPDIPAFSHISHEEYLRLRAEHVAVRRGLSDLARNPQARSQAIRRMEGQEQRLRQEHALTNAAGQLIPAAPSGPMWVSLGPAPIPNGQTFFNSVPVSGRVTAIAIDPTDVNGNTVYVGTAQGGVYRTLDGGATWAPLMDTALSLAIGSITIDPTDHNTVLVGTGEGNLALDSFFGVGVYVIQNATSPSPTLSGPFHTEAGTGNDVFTGRSVTKIIVNPTDHTKVLVATSSGVSGASGDTFSTLPTRGVYLSTNFFGVSPTFTRQIVQSASFPGTDNRPVTDMVMDPGNPNLILVNILGQSTTEGGVWVSPSTVWAGTGAWTQGQQNALNANGKLAVSRSASSAGATFFAASGESITCSSATVSGVLRTSTNGSTWTELPAARGFCGGQCFYDMPVAVDPTNAGNVFIGGQSGGSVGACGSSSLGKSTDGGTTFAASQNSLHADSHAIAIAPGNPLIIYEGNDGGIFRSADGGATWTSRNTPGFNATQFESVAVHPSDPNFTIGGTQDNGTEFLQPSGAWTRADGGDGGFSAIDQGAADTSTVTMYHTYFNSTGSQIGFARVTTVGSPWSFFGCGGATNGISCSDSVLFYAPLALGPGAPNPVYFGSDRLYRSGNMGTNATAVSQMPLETGVPVSAIGISPQDDLVRIVALRDGKAWATTSGSTTLTNVTGGWDPKYIARAVIDPNTKTTAYVTLDGYGTANHVWKTITLSGDPPTPTWNPASTGLPDVPVNAFVVDPAQSLNIYAGTDIGVFSSIDGGANWTPYGTGLPRVAVFDMKITAKHTLRVATHGRGMWETAAAGVNDDITLLVPSPSHIASGGTVTLTVTVNPGTVAIVPTGTVTFFDGAAALAAPVTLDGAGTATFSTTSFSNGVHNLTAVYSGDAQFRSSVSGTTQVGVGSLATVTALLAGPAHPGIGAAVTFTANVDTGASLALPTGTVTFTEGATVLRTVALAGSIVASFQTSALPVGTHTVLAQYSGDANYSGSTSTALVVNIGNPDYGINFPSGSSTVKAGQSASYTVNVTTTDGFAGTINFACPSGLPSLTNCSFNPASVTVNGNTGSSALTISTTAATVAPPVTGLNSRLTGAGFLALGMVLAGLAGRKRRRLQSAMMLVVVLGLLFGLSSCGGGGSNVQHNPGTPAGTYTVTVSATSGTTTHQSTITLVVQ